MPDALDSLAADLAVQRPAGAPQQLILLFHGVGSTPQNMEPLGRRLAAEFPQAAVVCIAGPDRCDLGAGHQWFSVQGITEENRVPRIAATLPRFVERVRAWQQQTGATEAQTALIGFSQGAIMALASTQADPARHGSPLAGRVVSIAGRFATPPEHAPAQTTLHFIHGKSDAVIPYAHTVTAAERLIRLGGDVTADVIPFLGHAVDQSVLDLVIERLKGHIPKRIWEEATRAAP
jgi:phospholipase/carboxylesterase